MCAEKIFIEINRRALLMTLAICILITLILLYCDEHIRTTQMNENEKCFT